MCPAPTVEGSFTKNLNQCLFTLLKSNPHGFSTSELFNELYHGSSAVKPHHFERSQSRHNYGKIMLRQRHLASRPVTEAKEAYSLNLTLQLNAEPQPFTIHELAGSLSFLPHVNQVRLESLYAPRDKLISTVWRLLPSIRVLRSERPTPGAQFFAPDNILTPYASRLAGTSLSQGQGLPFNHSSAGTIPSPSMRRQTWPTSITERPLEEKIEYQQLALGRFWPGDHIGENIPLRRAYTTGFLASNSKYSITTDLAMRSFFRWRAQRKEWASLFLARSRLLAQTICALKWLCLITTSILVLPYLFGSPIQIQIRWLEPI